MLKQLNRNKKKKGFTLIELVIVLAVLAIIALIAIPNFTKVREDSQAKSDLRSLESIAKVIDMGIIDEIIKDDVVGAKNIEITKSGNNFVVATNADLGIAGPEKAKLDAGLTKVNEPQQKNKTGYRITVTNGEITEMTTTP